MYISIELPCIIDISSPPYLGDFADPLLQEPDESGPRKQAWTVQPGRKCQPFHCSQDEVSSDSKGFFLQILGG